MLNRVHSSGGARVLQVMLARVVVVVVHVGRRKVLELVVVMRMMGSHCRGATVVSGHHFCNICSRSATKSHSIMLKCLLTQTASKSDDNGYRATNENRLGL